MATNRQVREALLKQLDITPQALSLRAKKRKRELPMSTELAAYTIAHENGIDVSLFLSKEETAEVRELVSQLQTKANGSTRRTDTPPRSEKAKTKNRDVLVNIAGVNIERVPGMTITHATEAKIMAERIYPTLYVFENSARDLISKVLENALGKDWWDKIDLPKIRTKAEGRKADEDKDPWHGKRGAALLDYLDLTDLPLIVAARKAWPHFKPFFNRPSWFQELVNELNVSRRVAAHMNPLENDDVKNVEAAFRKWSKLLQAKAHLIP